ncbi:hypothetical protein GQR58_025086 [Nymphon striatum]|nr:hypothetical protein GQR58_025086 [Nymphon striatum]
MDTIHNSFSLLSNNGPTKKDTSKIILYSSVMEYIKYGRVLSHLGQVQEIILRNDTDQAEDSVFLYITIHEMAPLSNDDTDQAENSCVFLYITTHEMAPLSKVVWNRDVVGIAIYVCRVNAKLKQANSKWLMNLDEIPSHREQIMPVIPEILPSTPEGPASLNNSTSSEDGATTGTARTYKLHQNDHRVEQLSSHGSNQLHHIFIQILKLLSKGSPCGNDIYFGIATVIWKKVVWDRDVVGIAIYVCRVNAKLKQANSKWLMDLDEIPSHREQIMPVSNTPGPLTHVHLGAACAFQFSQGRWGNFQGNTLVIPEILPSTPEGPASLNNSTSSEDGATTGTARTYKLQHLQGPLKRPKAISAQVLCGLVRWVPGKGFINQGRRGQKVELKAHNCAFVQVWLALTAALFRANNSIVGIIQDIKMDYAKLLIIFSHILISSYCYAEDIELEICDTCECYKRFEDDHSFCLTTNDTACGSVNAIGVTEQDKVKLATGDEHSGHDFRPAANMMQMSEIAIFSVSCGNSSKMPKVQNDKMLVLSGVRCQALTWVMYDSSSIEARGATGKSWMREKVMDCCAKCDPSITGAATSLTRGSYVKLVAERKEKEIINSSKESAEGRTFNLLYRKSFIINYSVLRNLNNPDSCGPITRKRRNVFDHVDTKFRKSVPVVECRILVNWTFIWTCQDCERGCKFLDVCFRWPGKSHNYKIFKNKLFKLFPDHMNRRISGVDVPLSSDHGKTKVSNTYITEWTQEVLNVVVDRTNVTFATTRLLFSTVGLISMSGGLGAEYPNYHKDLADKMSRKTGEHNERIMKNYDIQKVSYNEKYIPKHFIFKIVRINSLYLTKNNTNIKTQPYFKAFFWEKYL